MFMQVDKKTVHRNRAVLGLVLAFGEVEVDGKIRGSFPPPATITTGSGQPIELTAGAGNVTVRTN